MKKIICTLFCTAALFGVYSQTRPIATDINTIPAEGGKIKITWSSPASSEPKITGFAVYRDSKQISSYDQLNSQKPVAELASDVNVYFDAVPDSREYFYAVISLTENGAYSIILPSINTTVYGVKTAVSQSAKNTSGKQPPKQETSPLPKTAPSKKMREIPLPTLGLAETPKQKNIIGPKALAAAKSLGKDYTGRKNIIENPHIFEEDMVCPEGGDEYVLFKILKNYFVKNDFQRTVSELTEFLNVHRSDSVTNRAFFYLGESYYFSADYQNALFNFLTVKEQYPALSKKWIDSTLDLIEIDAD